jgi:Uma2 family endonuclease
MFSPVIEIPAETPRSIVLHPPLSDAEFERLCEKSDFAFLERSKEGAIIVNAPAGGMTSDGNSEINQQLRNWWKQHRRGRAFDSSAGFFLPDGSVLSPDASYVTAEQLKGLSRDELARFLRVAPAFVIELRSESDRLAAVAEKMKAWMDNGVEVGWLVDPYGREVHIYVAGATTPRIENGTHAAGSGPVEGFVLDLAEVWRCYE